MLQWTWIRHKLLQFLLILHRWTSPDWESILVYFLIHNLGLHSPLVCYQFQEKSQRSLMMFDPMVGLMQWSRLHLLGRRFWRMLTLMFLLMMLMLLTFLGWYVKTFIKCTFGLFNSVFTKASYSFFQMKYPSALNCFQQIMRQARNKQIVIFLDYDGTLSPIVDDPDRAFMSNEVHRTLLCGYNAYL